MAIQDSFNLSNALNSQAYAYKCWYNYNYGNNTMGISAKDMGEITQTWNGELNNWHATALDDENAYEIEDDDFSTAKNNGRNQAEDKTGYDGKQGGQYVRTGLDAAAGVAGALGSTIGSGVANSVAQGVAGGLIKNTAKKVGEKAATSAATKAAAEEAGKKAAEGLTGEAATKASEEAATKTTEEAAKNASDKVASKNVGWIITAPLALATGTAYTAKKPNKEQKEACDDLQDEMTNAQSALYTAQDDMSTMGDELTELSDEAQMANEDANDEIEEQKSEFDTYKATYDALMEKVEAGETLTDDEKELLQELVPIMQELGVGISETQEETTEVAGDIYDEMGTYQEGYDNAAATVGEVEGLTDYAESFDESTRTMCYVEAGAQTLNAASGTKAGLQAGKFAASGGIFTAWAWGFAAMGAAGAVQSGIGATQQFQWAGDVGTEIDMRRDTQDVNSLTNDIYGESIENYDGWMSGVEELEIEMPEDMEDPEEVGEALAEGAAAALGGEGEGGKTTDLPGLGSPNGQGNTAGTTTGGTTGGNSTTPTGTDDKDKEKLK